MMNTDPREDIVVNHVHPGFIDTDMAANLDEAIRQQGPKPIDRLHFFSFKKNCIIYILIYYGSLNICVFGTVLQ